MFSPRTLYSISVISAALHGITLNKINYKLLVFKRKDEIFHQFDGLLKPRTMLYGWFGVTFVLDAGIVGDVMRMLAQSQSTYN